MIRFQPLHNGAGVTLGALALVLAASSYAQEELPFGEARIFFELNDTDGDLGIHASIDGQPWKTLSIFDTRERTILTVNSIGRLRRQGMTQLFFESAEPPFDELPPEQFFERFPEGVYEVEAFTLDGNELEGLVSVSHVLAAPAGDLRVNGIPAGDECDAPNVPTVWPPVVVTWDPVTTSHPEVGASGPVAVERYQVFAEQRRSGGLKYSLDLPPSQTSYQIAPELLATGDAEYKFEIQVRHVNGNQTATENCFKVRR
jgi:hypothetical protein